MDPDNPRIALLKAWIHALRGQSTDRPHWEYSARASAIPGLRMRWARRRTWRGISRTRAREVRDRHDTEGQERGRCLPWLTETPSKTTSSALL